MKLIIDKKNYRNIYREIKEKKIQSLLIRCGSSFFSSPKINLALKKIADFCIERDIHLEIRGVPICFLLGYKKYLVFNGKNHLFSKSEKCGACLLFNECPGFLKKDEGVIESVIKPVRRNFTDLEICMLKILEKKNNITTEEVLKLSKGIKICASCSSEGEVLRVTDRLIKAGIIKMELIGGKYVWSKK
ncbi:MAG: hypothetical protein PHF44_04190 [Candidatus Pacebacteria bacterium]|nr:hypothetical protein [Candidatus Paceibacterota bacterium]